MCLVGAAAAPEDVVLILVMNPVTVGADPSPLQSWFLKKKGTEYGEI